MINTEHIVQLIVNTINELSDAGIISGIKNADEKTRLYGKGSGLDSLNLVALVIEVEERVSDALSIDLVLADERAMSMRRSPFRSVETLAEYIKTLAEESS